MKKEKKNHPRLLFRSPKIGLSVFLLIFSMYVSRAQSIIDVFQPTEECHYLCTPLFEPHYKKDGTIDYYGLGHVLRLLQTTNPDGKPEKVTIGMWDKYENDWEKFQEKECVYANGRLKEEKVWQYKQLPAGSNSPKLVRRNLHYFDETGRKDSILNSICLDVRNDKYDTLVVVNCLNQNDMIDVTRKYSLTNGTLLLIGRDYTTYKNKKPVEIMRESYWKLGERREHSDGIITVFPDDDTEKDKDKLFTERDYVCITYSHSGYEATYRYEDKNNSPYMLQKVKLDSEGRVCEVDLLTNTDSVLHAEYKYDDRKRTLVHKVINPAALEGSGIFAFKNIVNALGTVRMKYDMTYTEDGRQKTTYYFWDDKDSMFHHGQTVWLTYTPNGEVAVMEVDVYYEGEIYEKEKDEQEYNDKGELVLKLHHLWNKKDGWWISHKYVYDYDKFGNKILSQDLTTYDEGKSWKGNQSTAWTYDDKGHMLSKISYGWSKNQWTGKNKTLWTYTPNGKIASEKKYNWDDDYQKDWVKDTYYSVSYDENDSIRNKTVYEPFPIETSESFHYWKCKWVPKNASEFAYFPNEKQETTYYWKNDVRIPYHLYKSYAVADSTSESVYDWNQEKNKWEIDRRYAEYTRGDSIKVEEKYDSQNEFGILAGYTKTVKRTDLAPNCSDEIRYTWDFDKKDWIPLKRSKSYYDEEKGYINTTELYDKATGVWKIEPESDEE